MITRTTRHGNACSFQNGICTHTSWANIKIFSINALDFQEIFTAIRFVLEEAIGSSSREWVAVAKVFDVEAEEAAV